MYETAEELARWPALAERLRDCESLILPAFRPADSAAIRHQRLHRWLTMAAALFGTSAVLFAILQLASRDLQGGKALEDVEIAAACVALLAVALGLISGLQSRWILDRHKAERLRLAKFGFLIDPDTWSDIPATVEQRVADLRAEVSAIRTVTPRQFHKWTEREEVHLEPPMREDQPSSTTRDQLVDYYRLKRLLFQRDIFRSRAHRHDRWDRESRRLGPFLFLGSVSAAAIHFIVDHFQGEQDLRSASTRLILVAAALPAFGAGVRTLRTAYEYARNTSRYRAKAVALSRVDFLLGAEKDPSSKIRLLEYTEGLLRFEHHEWCRLMIEAEWLP